MIVEDQVSVPSARSFSESSDERVWIRHGRATRLDVDIAGVPLRRHTHDLVDFAHCPHLRLGIGHGPPSAPLARHASRAGSPRQVPARAPRARLSPRLKGPETADPGSPDGRRPERPRAQGEPITGYRIRKSPSLQTGAQPGAGGAGRELERGRPALLACLAKRRRRGRRDRSRWRRWGQ